MYPTGCLPNSCLLFLLKLSFASLVYHNNSLNAISLPFICLTITYAHLFILLAILVSSLINLSFTQHISFILSLPTTQTNSLQLVLNSAARAVTKTLKFHHFTATLKSLHALAQDIRENERIEYKVLSHTYKSLKTGLPSCLRSFLSLHSHRCTRSSFLITLSRPSLTSSSRLKTDIIILLFCFCLMEQSPV